MCIKKNVHSILIMGKVILFDKSNYDIKGTYRSYNIDYDISEDYVLLFIDSKKPLEINSIMNVDTNYYVTLLYIENDRVNLVNIDGNIDYIKTGFSKTTKMLTKFNMVYLTKRSLINNVDLNTLILFNVEKLNYNLDEFANYTKKYTNNKEDAFIKHYVEFETCKKLTDEFQTKLETLESLDAECQLKSKSLNELEVEYNKIQQQLKTQIKELRNENKYLLSENKKSNETESKGAYFLGVLICFGIVMFLYCVYISTL